MARRYDQAIEQFRRTLELDAGFALAHYFLGFAYEAKENYQEAVTEYQRALNVLGNLPELLACLGRVHALAGRTDEARAAIDELRCLSAQRPVPPALIALIYTAIGDKDEAFHWLERAYAEHDADLCLLKVDPRLDSLRGDSRFTSLLQRVGLASSNHITSSK